MGAAVCACGGPSLRPPSNGRQLVRLEERRGGSQAGDDEDRISFQELAKPWRVFRNGLQPGPQPAARRGPAAVEALAKPRRGSGKGLPPGPQLALRVGPVVGKVTDTTAVVLLEVEAPGGDVTVNVARALRSRPSEELPSKSGWLIEPPLPALPLASMDFAAAGSVSASQIMEPCKAYSFNLEGLEPETAYFVFIGGVSEEDLQRRVARFRTLPQRMDGLRLLAVSGHRPAAQDLGSADPWQRLHQMACERPEAHLVLHLGSTVHAAPAAAEAALAMRDHGSFRVGIRRELERRARDAMRGAFAAAWGRHEGLRRVLAEVGSHLPAFSPVVDLESLLQSAGRAETAEERRTLVRLALEVSREYQRALWQSSRSGGACSVSIRAGGGAYHYREFLQDVGPVSDMSAEEWHLHRYGQITVVVLDTKGGLLSSCGLGGKAAEASAAEGRPLLSQRQGDALGRVLRESEIRVLILACDMPFLLEPELALGADSGFLDDGPASASDLGWRSHAAELQRLLESLFEWKGELYPNREVVLLSAGPGFGTTGDVWDQKLGLSMPTVLTGPVLGPASAPSRWALKGSLPGARFSWAYRPPVEAGNFCVLDVDLSASPSGKPAIDIELVSMPLPPGVSWPEGPRSPA